MTPRRPILIVHGGAGRIRRDEDLADILAGCTDAALAGWKLLKSGGAALDAAQTAVEALEDNPLFNSGTGAVLNSEGHIQLDASLMDGETRTAGAVAAVSGIRNPVRLARKILDDGRHVLLVGQGALQFARSAGIDQCDESELIVPRQRKRWEQKYGTVGCVALDIHGHIAVATSTGGILGALPGRVGDSALIGCGTYASRDAGVSCTGIGEAIIRSGLARTAVEGVAAGRDALSAAQHALAEFEMHTRSQAGLIIIDCNGRAAYVKNTPCMPVCIVRDADEVMTDC